MLPIAARGDTAGAVQAGDSLSGAATLDDSPTAAALALRQRVGGTLHALCAESWVLRVRNFRPGGADFDEAWAAHPPERREVVVFGRRCFENRFSRAYGRAYAYSGQVAAATPFAESAVAAELLERCNAACFGDGGIAFNACLANWYEPEHHIARHRDDERALDAAAPVASVSWGAPRRFVVRPRGGGESLDLVLGDGDLLVMGGACQRTHTHEVPKPRRKDRLPPGRRVSWTFRRFLDAPPEKRPEKRRRRDGDDRGPSR